METAPATLLCWHKKTPALASVGLLATTAAQAVTMADFDTDADHLAIDGDERTAAQEAGILPAR